MCARCISRRAGSAGGAGCQWRVGVWPTSPAHAHGFSAATTRRPRSAATLVVQHFARCIARPNSWVRASAPYQIFLLQEKKRPGRRDAYLALRFLHKRTLKRRDLAFDDLIFPKVPHKLPTVLSQDEVVRLIEAAPNRLYRMILVLLYATGVRRTEAARIKVEDIDSQRMVIHIRQGKGARDRDVPLSPKLLEELRSWWRWKKPRGYLFPSTAGQRGVDQPISDKTVWHACHIAATHAGLKKKIHPHTLRHSFATHLLEAGTDLRTIQLLMGHERLEDTTVYLQLSRRHLHAAVNPLEQITLRAGQEDRKR